MRNGGELSDLEYLPVKTEYTKYLQIVTYLDYLPTKQKMRNISRTRTREPLIYWGPLNNSRIHFKRALNH